MSDVGLLKRNMNKTLISTLQMTCLALMGGVEMTKWAWYIWAESGHSEAPRVLSCLQCGSGYSNISTSAVFTIIIRVQQIACPGPGFYMCAVN